MTQDLEARTFRRVAWRIVPLVMVLYFVAFIDRVNIGFAALTMNEDLGLSPTVFGIGAGLFFVGYFLFEVPSNLILHRVGARRWIGRIIVSWGLVSMGMALVQGPASFYALRFLLGLAEAGFFPGIILYLTYWFPAPRRAWVVALFMAAAPISSVIGAPLSAYLMSFDGAFGLQDWQWLFILEGFPAVALGLGVLVFMPDRPSKAAWLRPDEREWLTQTLAAEAAAQAPHAQHSPWRALADARVLALALTYFGTSAGLYTINLWGPQFLESFGLSTTQVGWLTAVPPAAAVIAMILWARHSDRTRERHWHVAVACAAAALGLMIAGIAGALAAAVAALVLANIGIAAAKPPLWALPSLFLSGPAAAAGIAAVNAFGNLGGFAGPFMIGWIREQTGSFAGGLYFVAALLAVSACLVVLLGRLTRGHGSSPVAAIGEG